MRVPDQPPPSASNPLLFVGPTGFSDPSVSVPDKQGPGVVASVGLIGEGSIVLDACDDMEARVRLQFLGQDTEDMGQEQGV